LFSFFHGWFDFRRSLLVYYGRLFGLYHYWWDFYGF
jgi:hypothetical protein